MKQDGVTRLEPKFVERIWGVTRLSPWFADPPVKIGEVWFPAGQDFPLLVKFIFTSERLSVQVHPADDYAKLHENSRGKTEMWHILEVRPGAEIAIGLREPVSRERLQKSIENGEVEHLLNWVPVQPGETYFTQAGVIHAIGAGVTLCEIQQNSDITYRLYDYGRPRELHLARGLDVSSLDCYEGRRDLPVRCEHFVTEEIRLPGRAAYEPVAGTDHLLITLEGSGMLNGASFHPGQVWRVATGSTGFSIEPRTTARLLRTYAPVV
ncbi:MAG: class I mannose-6-phosphate isomerase [Bryobacteraceae bacterium]